MAFDLGTLLSQFTNGQSSATAPDDYQRVVEQAPPSLVSRGLAGMFASDQTPAFGQANGQLFSAAHPTQQAGLLNELLGGMGPGVLASLASGVGGGALGSLLQRFTQGGQGGQGGATPTVTPEQASQLSPDDVAQVAAHAEQHSPGIVDRMSDFYAQHPGLVKTLGGAALTIAMARMAGHQNA